MRISVFEGMVNLTVDNFKKTSKYQVKKRARKHAWDETEDRNVDNFLINKADRKTINIIFLSALFIHI
ncbi:hypothetical protein IMSAG025_01695 [Muribaculaceae bacterium]|nr:hypothetical protein IMSAG025_01695 [Muribaculaceae bacterium]